MNNLNAQQVILVALLVAIVTSITTGIVIFSLSDQSGGNVSQTIYRVVEKTIAAATTPDSPVRNIVPAKPDTSVTPTQLPLSTIASNAGKSLIRIYSVEQGSGQKTFVTDAVSLGSKGLLVGVDLGTNGTVIAEGSNLHAVTADGQEFQVSVKKQAFIGSMSLFALVDSKDQAKITSAPLTNFGSLKLGSNVIAFGGKETDNVISTGIVSEFKGSGNVTNDNSDIAVTDMMLTSRISGFELLDTSGNLVGLIYLFEPGQGAKYLSIDEIKKLSETL